MSSVFALQIVRGTHVGKTWRVTRENMVIGRSADCSIRIVDPTVSRRHCQVWLDDDGTHVRDLKSSNETLVNGLPVSEALLAPDDEIDVGSYSLRLVCVDSPTPTTVDPADASTPATLALSEGFFIGDASNESESESEESHVSLFRALLQANRDFAKCTTVSSLTDALAATLNRRFEPEAMCLARLLPPENRVVPYPCYACAPFETLPTADIQKALANKCGFLMPRRRVRQGKPSIETTLIAPLIVADEQIGMLAVRTSTPRRVYDETDLEFFLALAHSFAPYLLASEQTEQLRRDVEHLRSSAGVENRLIGSSDAIKHVRDMATRAAKSDLPVLILGETGTGKEVVARMIHEHSNRAKQAYVIVNAAAIPRELFESEMFGHEKGAFTGASKQKIGYFEDAHTGTLFLDEIGDLSPDNQVRILRAIETGRFNRVGGTREINVDVRIVSATNRALAGKQHAADFRQDLYHRLSGFIINMPPLRNHKQDIPALVEHFLRRGLTANAAPRMTISAAALEKLASYSWPGNVRELRSCVERGAALAYGDVIEEDDVMLPIEAGKDPDSSSHLLTLADAERHHIQRVLRRNKGNIRSAAQALKISRVTLYKKINDYNISI